MKKRYTTCMATILCCILYSSLLGNNATISNPQYNKQTRTLTFDIGWNNGFRVSTEWFDYIHLVIKVKNSNENTWNPAPAFTATAISLQTPNSSNGGYTGVWHSPGFTSGTDGGRMIIQFTSGTFINPSFKIMAIEMVYADHEDLGYTYNFGDGITRNRLHDGSDEGLPFSWAPPYPDIEVGDQAGELGSTFNIPLPFAMSNIHKSMMKYEITQGMYVDFLNCLTRPQQDTRTETDLSIGVSEVTEIYVMSARTFPSLDNGIRCASTIPSSGRITFFCDGNNNGIGNETDDGLDRACNYLGSEDTKAILDWLHLMPMLQVEYELWSRGGGQVVPGEYAWGSTAYHVIDVNGWNQEGTSSEVHNDLGTPGAHVSTNFSAKRVGAFAGATTTREQSGASFYGIMDLSGSLSESIYSLLTTNGASLPNPQDLGDGIIGIHGNHNQSSWNNTILMATGKMLSYGSGNPISLLNNVIETERSSSQGARGVR